MRPLAPEDIERLLAECSLGRLGIYDQSRRRVYVVPLSYAYHDGAIYMHSAPGLKLDLLRRDHNQVCFEVDDVIDAGHWRSVIVWGRVEEVADPVERQLRLRAFGDALFRGPLRDRQNMGRGGALGQGETVFRLIVDEVTGRFDGELEPAPSS